MKAPRMTAAALAASVAIALTGCSGGDEPKAPTGSATSTATSSPSASGSSASGSSTSGSSAGSATADGSSSASGSATSSSATSTAPIPTPTSTTKATPEFIRAVAKGMFRQARNAPTWSMNKRQSRCVAEGLVKRFGTDRLVGWGLSQRKGAVALDQLGLSEDEAGLFVDSFSSCGVITRERLITSVKKDLGKDAKDPKLVACLESTIDAQRLRALMIDQLLRRGNDAPSSKDLQDALVDCVS